MQELKEGGMALSQKIVPGEDREDDKRKGTNYLFIVVTAASVAYLFSTVALLQVTRYESLVQLAPFIPLSV